MDLVLSYRDDLRFARKAPDAGRCSPSCWRWPWLVLALAAPASWTARDARLARPRSASWARTSSSGTPGLVSFGQAGFLAIGAFAFAHLRAAGVPFLWPWRRRTPRPRSSASSVGFPSLRLKGPYLAIATLGFGIAVYQVLANSERLSGGRTGMAVPRLAPLSRPVPERLLYYVYLRSSWPFSRWPPTTSCRPRSGARWPPSATATSPRRRWASTSRGTSCWPSPCLPSISACRAPSSPSSSATWSPRTSRRGVAHPVRRGDRRGPRLRGGRSSARRSSCWCPALGSEAGGSCPLVFGVALLLVMLFEPLGLAGRWRKLRLYFESWPFRYSDRRRLLPIPGGRALRRAASTRSWPSGSCSSTATRVLNFAHGEIATLGTFVAFELVSRRLLLRRRAPRRRSSRSAPCLRRLLLRRARPRPAEGANLARPC